MNQVKSQIRSHVYIRPVIIFTLRLIVRFGNRLGVRFGIRSIVR